MSYNGEVKINTKMDNSGIDEGIDAAVARMKRLTGALNGVHVQIAKQKAVVDVLTKKYNDAAEAAERIGRAQGKDSHAYAQAAAEVDKIAQSLFRAEDKMSDFVAQANELENAINEIDPGTIDDVARAAEDAAQQKQELADRLQQIARLARTAGRVSARAMGKVAAVTGRAALSAMKLGGNILSLGIFARKSSRGMGMFRRQLMRVALMATVFMVLRRGLMALSTALGNVLRQNTEFAAAWNEIRVNLLTAFAPIWEVIMPALIRFMQILAQVTAMLAQFFATLFGRTVAQARSGAKALNSAAQGIENVGGAASGANDELGQLASFDQINQLAPDTSGGDGGGTDGGGMDLDIPIRENIGWLDELAERFRNFFREADFDYWFGLGKAAAARFADALERIPWESIREGARVAGENLAGLMGGFLSYERMWVAIGRTVGETANTILDFAHSFSKAFPWVEVGSAIAAGWNELFSVFDFNLLGATIGSWLEGLWNMIWSFAANFDWGGIVRGAVDTITGFFETVNWAQAARIMSNGIINIFSSLADAITNTDWLALGRLIGGSIRDFIANVDWGGIWESFKGFFSSAFSGLRDFLTGLFDSEHIANAILAIGAALLGLKAAIAIIIGVKKVWTAVTTALTVAKTALAAVKAVLLSPITLIVAAIAAVIAIVVMLIKHWDTVKEVASRVWDAIVGFVTAAWDAIVGVFSAVVDWFSSLFSNAWQGIQNAWNSVVGWFSGIWDGIVSIFRSVASWFSDRFRAAWQGIKSIWDAVVAWFQGVWNGIVRVFSVVVQWFADMFRRAWQGIQNIWNAVVGWFRNVWNGITGVFSVVATWFTNIFRNAWQGIQNIWGSVIAWFQNIWTTIQSGATGAFNAIVNGAIGMVNRLIDAINNMIRLALTPINALISALNKVPGVNIPSVSVAIPNIPHLARGGIVDSATIAMIGEKGREAVVPLENNTQWLNEIAKRLDKLQGGGSQDLPPIEVIIEVDRQIFGRAVVKLGDAARQRIGARIQPRAVLTT